MTRFEAYSELKNRLETDIKNGADYCIGEDRVRRLFKEFWEEAPFGHEHDFAFGFCLCGADRPTEPAS